MRITHLLIWISKRKEREIIELCREHLDHVINVVKYMHHAIEAFVHGDKEKLMEVFARVFAHERQADEIKRRVIYALSRGLVHPIDRENLIRLVLTADDIADYAKSATRKLCMALPMELDREIGGMLLKIGEETYRAATLVKETVYMLTEDPKRAIELANEVENCEERIDDLRVDLMTKILEKYSTTPVSVKFMLLKEAIDSIEMTADKCEDLADVVRGIAVSIL